MPPVRLRLRASAQADIISARERSWYAENDYGSRRRAHRGRPRSGVEILSPSTAYRDRGLKLDRYQKAGVSEYWMVDPERKVVQQYVLTEGVFRSTGEHSDRSAVACTGTPDGEPIEVDLSEVW